MAGHHKEKQSGELGLVGAVKPGKTTCCLPSVGLPVRGSGVSLAEGHGR